MLDLEGYKQLELGWEYQDFITSELIKLGICTNIYQSGRFQMLFGESASGIEIKNDRNMEKTGNIYFEFEQTTMRGTVNKESGIKQKDNSWLYIIGDYRMAYIFGKVHLQSLYDKVQKKPAYWWNTYKVTIRPRLNENREITSYGLVVPIEYIEQSNLAIKKLVFERKDNGTGNH